MGYILIPDFTQKLCLNELCHAGLWRGLFSKRIMLQPSSRSMGEKDPKTPVEFLFSDPFENILELK